MGADSCCRSSSSWSLICCGLLTLVCWLPFRSSKGQTEASGQPSGQRQDGGFSPSLKVPRFRAPDSPVVAIDEGHQNFHTKDGRYRPFAKVLEADGYVVQKHLGPFSIDSLRGVDVLVVANAAPSGAVESTDSAFETQEIELLVTWIRQGGALMLLADHRPFGEAARQLGGALGVEMSGGYVLDSEGERGLIRFTRKNGQLGKHSITQGANPQEAVTEVVSFTGQALRFPASFHRLMSFGPHTVRYEDREAIANNRISGNVSDWHQGGVAQFGKGRVAIFGEAGMFSAQVNGQRTMGMNFPGAEQNELFLRNVVRWLATSPP